MNKANQTRTGHLTSGGPLLHVPKREGQRRGALVTNRANEERKKPNMPIALNWTRKPKED
jgi:hypothetical protein